MNWVQIVAMVSAVVVLAEATNKLERADPFSGKCGLLSRLRSMVWLFVPWRWRRQRVLVALKIAGWFVLAMGAAGHVARLLMPVPLIFTDVAVIAGFALLIVRSRLKEG